MANTNIYDMADTWNAAGTTFTAIKMNVTDTASAAGSLLMDLQVGGASKFNVTKAGAVRASDGSVAAPSLSFISQPGSGFLASGAAIKWSSGGVDGGIFGAAYFAVPADNSFRWSSTSDSAGATDLILARDAANILAQRNGTNAQASRLYFSYTDAANYTRLALKTATGVHTLETESAGTGEANIDLALTPKGTGRVRFGTHSALAAETVTGYITIKDAGGTERKVAVVS